MPLLATVSIAEDACYLSEPGLTGLPDYQDYAVLCTESQITHLPFGRSDLLVATVFIHCRDR